MGTGVAVSAGDTITAAKMNLKLESIVNADVEAGAAIADSKINPVPSTALTTHAALTTGTHGAGASTIATTANIATHEALTTGAHGVGASTIASAADIATHAALTTGTHGAGASTLATTANITTHEGLTTGIHGVGGSTVASAADITTHNGVTNPHSSTAAATPDRLMLRDAAGRCAVVAPAAATDIALKSTVTADIATHAALTAVHGATGALVPSNPPALKKKVTNIYYDPTDGQIKYEVEP